MSRKTIAFLIKTMGFVALAMWIYAGYLYESFRTHPVLPDLINLRTIPFFYKSKTLYLSASENFEYNFHFYGSWALVVVYIAAYYTAQRLTQDLILFPQSLIRRTDGRSQNIAMSLVLLLIVIVAIYLSLK